MTPAKRSIAFLLAAGAATLAVAAAPPDAPAGSTARCKDGSYDSAGTRRRACQEHGGLKRWYGAARSASPIPAVQTQSASVNATGAAPSPGGPSLTPGRPAAPASR